MLVKLAICLANNAFRDNKTIHELLALESPNGEMYQLEWEPSMLDTPFYQDAEGEMTQHVSNEIDVPQYDRPVVRLDCCIQRLWNHK